MASFVIVICSRCDGLVAARAEQKTKTCPYCGSRIVLCKCRRVAYANGAREASQTLRKLKVEVAEKEGA